MNIRQALSAHPEAEKLLVHIVGWSAPRLRLESASELSAAQQRAFEQSLRQLRSGIPVAYIHGVQDFYKHPFYVNENVLIPRPDSEILVEQSLSHIDDKPDAHVLELGVGSGAILISLALEKPKARFLGTDKYLSALQVARRNAQQLKADISLLQTDWFIGIGGSFSVILSNPPYIPTRDPHLDHLQHEPITALISGEDGLRDIRHIIRQAPDYLLTGGWLLLEHGYDQQQAVATLLMERGFQQVCCIRDLGGNPRVTKAQWPE